MNTMLEKYLAQPDGPCPTDLLLATLSGRWTMPIVWALFEEGPWRFAGLKRRITGISARLLTERLRMLEAHGFVSRHEEPTVPPQVTYTKTARLEGLCEALAALDQVAREWHVNTRATASLGKRPRRQ
jgi:DNA-binding HxlR family transcriptional regulator